MLLQEVTRVNRLQIRRAPRWYQQDLRRLQSLKSTRRSESSFRNNVTASDQHASAIGSVELGLRPKLYATINNPQRWIRTTTEDDLHQRDELSKGGYGECCSCCCLASTLAILLLVLGIAAMIVLLILFPIAAGTTSAMTSAHQNVFSSFLATTGMTTTLTTMSEY